jgi:hypothetical protein
LLDFKNLPEPQNSKEINDLFYDSQIKNLQIPTEKISQLNLSENQSTEQNKELQVQIQVPPKSN